MLVMYFNFCLGGKEGGMEGSGGDVLVSRR